MIVVINDVQVKMSEREGTLHDDHPDSAPTRHSSVAKRAGERVFLINAHRLDYPGDGSQ